MALFTWWHSDALPPLHDLNGFDAAASDNAELLAGLVGLDLNEVQRRFASAHRPYIAYLDATPVAYGWLALEGAEIGELGLRFRLAAGDRYLWDFATLPAWRGRGIYPRLLQAILRAEARSAERFWIIHAPENHASHAGIAKAGFRNVGELSFRRGGGTGLIGGDHPQRAHAGAALLGVPLIEAAPIRIAQQEPLAPCWRCVIDAQPNGAGFPLGSAEVSCWPMAAGAPAASRCSCGG